MKIAKRTATGWTERQANKQKYNCDDCNAKLWVAPDGKTIYCNSNSPLHKVKTPLETQTH